MACFFLHSPLQRVAIIIASASAKSPHHGGTENNPLFQSHSIPSCSSCPSWKERAFEMAQTMIKPHETNRNHARGVKGFRATDSARACPGRSLDQDFHQIAAMVRGFRQDPVAPGS